MSAWYFRGTQRAAEFMRATVGKMVGLGVQSIAALLWDSRVVAVVAIRPDRAIAGRIY
jgi:hypothetical protein